ncbi:MAG: MmgE/PrpD family protein [Acetobacteraceae bacterium]|nr:MmgE/PrpD family protein [Acetobacteraceae bacterium]
MTETLSLRIGAFSAGFTPAHMTAEEAHMARRALLDTLACALGGLNEPPVRAALRYARATSGPAAARVWGLGERLGLEQAAFVNGVAGHVLDFDDVTGPLRGHPSVAMLPALCALAEAEGKGLAAVCAAFVAGFEVMGRMGEAIGDEHYARGFHATATIGVLGTTVACANLLGLSARQTADAIGLAVAQAAGSRENFGTDAKSFQAAHANRAALQSVLLAREGFDSSPAALDGPRGYVRLYGAGEDAARAFETLGQEPRLLLRARLEVKKYPMCYATHRTLDGLLDLKAETGIGLADVAAVEVEGSARAFAPLLHDRPQTGLEGKFSLQYAVAAALADGRVTLASFADAAVRRDAIQAFMPRVTGREGTGPLNPRYADIAVRLKDGRTLRRRVEALRGGPDMPLTDAQLAEKLADCVAHAGLRADAGAIAALVLDPADRPVAAVLDLLDVPARAAAAAE